MPPRSEEASARARAHNRERYANDPKYREHKKEQARRANADPAKAARKRSRDADYREQNRERIRARNAAWASRPVSRQLLSELNKRRYRERKAIFDAIKVERGCIDCGWNEHPAGRDFDHRDPSMKVLNVSRVTLPLSNLLAEVEKCDVRCARCHRVKTATAGDTRRRKETS